MTPPTLDYQRRQLSRASRPIYRTNLVIALATAALMAWANLVHFYACLLFPRWENRGLILLLLNVFLLLAGRASAPLVRRICDEWATINTFAIVGVPAFAVFVGWLLLL